MVITRTEFIKTLMQEPGWKFELSDVNGPLWIPEREMGSVWESQWFTCVKPVTYETKAEYWGWCNTNLKYRTACYLSDDTNQEEWWGFEDKNDTVLWLLRWG